MLRNGAKKRGFRTILAEHGAGDAATPRGWSPGFSPCTGTEPGERRALRHRLHKKSTINPGTGKLRSAGLPPKSHSFFTLNPSLLGRKCAGASRHGSVCLCSTEAA